MRQRRPATDRVNLQEGTQKARLLILSKVKVSVTEVRKAKERNGKKNSSEFARKKEERRRIHGPGNQRQLMINPSLSD